jgi:hypothetical protein
LPHDPIAQRLSLQDPEQLLRLEGWKVGHTTGRLSSRMAFDAICISAIEAESVPLTAF